MATFTEQLNVMCSPEYLAHSFKKQTKKLAKESKKEVRRLKKEYRKD